MVSNLAWAVQGWSVDLRFACCGPWFRSIDLRFACCGLWFEFWLLEEFLLGFVELGFRIALGFESSSSSFQAGRDILLLCGLLLVWISSALGYLWKPDALPSAFWESKWRHTRLTELDFIKGKFITGKDDFTKESILRLCDSTLMVLLLFVGT